MKQTVAIPFLDYLITSITTRFDKHTTQAAALHGSCPHTYHQLPHLMVFDPLSPSILRISPMLMFDEERHRWNSKWLKIPQNDRPISLNINILVK